MENSKIIPVVLLTDDPENTEEITTIIKNQENYELEDVFHINDFGEKQKRIHAEIAIIDLRKSRQSSRKFLKLLPFNDIKIIFSSFPDLALDAFDAGAIDFLVPPVDENRFFLALNKARVFCVSPLRPRDKYSRLEKNNLFYDVLQNKYRISDSCCEVCKYILIGKNRAEIIDALKISENTLKVYLRDIYSRTIEKNEENPTNIRSKFHLLYMFLNDIYKSL